MRHFVRLLFLLVLFPAFTPVIAQIPANCLEIESILVDPCGLSESKNEMVRFRVGATPLNIGQMTVTWPQGAWGTVCNGITTVQILQQLNSSIQGCGALIDPPGGIIPAGAEAILFTSTIVSPSSNSFVNLQDTLYAVFQCNASSTTPYFPNYNQNPATYDLIIGFNTPAGCGDTVTYDRSNLVNFSGNPGPGNGSRVDFTWSGTASYANDGCFGPFPPLEADAGADTTICTGDSARLHGQTAISFGHRWSGGSGTITHPDSLETGYMPGAGETGQIPLVLTAWSSCDTVRDTVILWIINSVTVSLGPDAAICTGGSVTLNSGYPGADILWSTGDTTSTLVVTSGGTYSVTVTTPCGTDSDTLVVTESPGPTVNAGADQESCINNNPVLNATVSSGNIQWYTSGGGTFSSPNAANTNYNPVPGDTGTVQIILEVTDACGTIFDTLEIFFHPDLTLSLSSTDSLCGRDTIPLNYFGNADSVRWFGGTGTFLDPFQANTGYIPGNGEYGPVTLQIEARNFCTATTDTLKVYVREQLTADFDCTPMDVFLGTEVRFLDLSSGNVLNYSWDFGDSVGSTVAEPTHTWNSEGTYTVTMIVSGEPACPDTATKQVEVTSEELVIPNLLTPNGDGFNDDFRLKVPPTETYLLSIYDRWGNPVFSSENPNDAWDGTSGSGNCPEGVYFFILKATTTDFQSIKEVGDITLMR